MHMVKNYGSALQAYALMKYINSLGYEAEIVDYEFPNLYHIKKSIPSPFGRFKLFLRENLRVILLEPFLKRNTKFKRFVTNELQLSQKHYKSKEELAKDPPCYDIYVTGSDQVWNVNKIYEDDSYLCAFADADKKKISFGASFTINELPKNEYERFSKLLGRYSAIGVREKSSLKILDCLRLNDSIDICNTCDPTLLLDASDYERLSAKSKVKIDGDFILVHQLEYNFSAEPMISIAIQEAKKKYNCKMVLIDHMFKKVEKGDIKLCNLGPNEFVWLFQHAKAVVTSSFHGTMFSIIFRKPFVSIAPSKEHTDRRIADVLLRLGLTDNLVYNEGERGSVIWKVGYTPLHEDKIIDYVKESQDFLKNALIL